MGALLETVMKIVHVITRLVLGGAQENTLFTCEGLRTRGHEVTLITGPSVGPEGHLLQRARDGGYEVIEVPSLRRAINPWHDLRCYVRLKQLLRQLQPDIVHTHSAKAGILGRWAAAALRQDAGDACCGPLRALRQAQQAQCRRPVIVHTIHGLAFHPYQSKLKNRIYIAAERSAAKSTDAFITVAQAMTDQALAAGVGRPEQYTKVLSGLETKDYLCAPTTEQIAQWRHQLNIPPDAQVVITVARLAELKGHDCIIQAAKQIARKHPNVIWLLVGDGHRRARIERQIQAAQLHQQFRLTGLVPPQRVPELIHASDILVHCSLREGLARVLPQALLCGKPVVSFDVDGAREVVVTGETGFLVPPHDLSGVIRAQETLLSDAQLRQRLGATGRRRCREEFDHQVMVDRIEAVYRSLV